MKAYKATLAGCCGCHEASGKAVPAAADPGRAAGGDHQLHARRAAALKAAPVVREAQGRRPSRPAAHARRACRSTAEVR